MRVLLSSLLLTSCSSTFIVPDPGDKSDDETGLPDPTSPRDTPETSDTAGTTPVQPFDDDLGLSCAPQPVALGGGSVPQRSMPYLTTSNGFVTATYAIDANNVPASFTDGGSGLVSQSHKLVTFTDHLVRNPTPSTTSRDLLWDSYYGIRIDGVSTWLDTVPEDSVRYEPGTGILEIVQSVSSARITARIFAPMQMGAGRDLAMVVEVEWLGSSSAEISLVALHNAHTGGEGQASGESVTLSGGSVLETRGSDQILHTPLGGAAIIAAPAGDPANPWIRFSSGGNYDGTLISGSDVAVGFQWSASLQPGGSTTVGSLMSIGSADRSAFVAGRTAEQLLEAEREDWADWHLLDDLPAGATEDERMVAAQSLAVLRMAQVREPGSGYGQILASLPPGGWNISWPRDAAYAIVGLVHGGHDAEARDALDFMIRGSASTYASWLGLSDYLISVARYYGDGTEESDLAWCQDGSEAGPNIELDDWGLFLWAYGEYASANPTDPWVDATRDAVITGVADPLIALIEPSNNLLTADSSIWERHWNECFPNGRKQFSYSSIQAVAGLREAAWLAADPIYELAANQIRSGLLRAASEGGPVVSYTSADGQQCAFIASSPEETCTGCGAYDGSVVEIINHEIVRPESSASLGTLWALQDRLAWIPNSPGFLRADDGAGSTNPWPWYDDQEWVVIDLRVASALAKVGRATGDPVLLANSEALFGWITSQARANHDLLGELLSDGIYTPEDDADRFSIGTDPGGQYQGSAPMCGFGPGAYLLALEDLRG